MQKSKGMPLITNNKQLRDVSFTLRNLFSSKFLDTSQILIEAGKMDAHYRSAFYAGAKQISTNGWSFTQAVSSIFPERELKAITAGEESGKLFEVFDQIWKAAKVQEEINKVMRGLNAPIGLLIFGIVVCLGFFLFLVPNMYRSLAGQVGPDYKPSAPVQAAISSQEWLLNNYEIVSIVTIGIIFAIVAALSKREVRERLSDWILMQVIKIQPVGIAYSSLKFGILAKYLEIVSAAGLEMEVRMALVVDLLPRPMRGAMNAFRAELVVKGLQEASRAEGRSDDDPRSSPVLWPPYIRLAIFQAHETGVMEEPMREYGLVMIEDGKEKLQQQITILLQLSMVLVGFLITIPIALMYGTMGEVLTMRMRQL